MKRWWVPAACLVLMAASCAVAQRRWDATSLQGEEALLRRDLPTAEQWWRYAKGAAKFNPGDHRDAQRALTHLAVIEDLRGNHDRANRLYARAQAADTPLLANVYAPIAALLVEKGMAYRREGRYVDAARLYQRAFMVVTLPVIPAGHDGRQVLEPFPTLLADPVDLPAAEAAYRRSLAAQEAKQGPLHPDLGWTLTALGDLAAAQGRYAEAEERYRRGIEVRRAGMGPGDVETIQSINTLEAFFVSLGRGEQAGGAAREAQRAWNLRQPEQRTPTVGDLHIYARMAELSGNNEEADRLYARMFDAWEAAGPHVKRHPAMRTLLNDYARFLRHTGREAEAAEIAQRAAGV